MEWLKQIAPTIATVPWWASCGPCCHSDLLKYWELMREKFKMLLESGKLNAEQIASVKTSRIELERSLHNK